MLILFLSSYRDRPKISKYDTDRSFKVTGAQTNEAPVKYAIERLKEKGEALDKIIALTTPDAIKCSAFELFCIVIGEVSRNTDIVKVKIDNNVSTSILLRETLKELEGLQSTDRLIIETTGGFRNAINALTLLARFLRIRHGDNRIVEFSTFSDLQQLKVSDTKETDDLFELLEAVNVFATSGNPIPLKNAMRDVKDSPEKNAFMNSISTFYDTVLCCKMTKMDDAVHNLERTIKALLTADYKDESPMLIVFKEIVNEIISAKMKFISAKDYLIPLIRWCCENDYVQQAVIILVEKVYSYMQPYESMDNGKKMTRYRRKKREIGKKINYKTYTRMVKYRDNFAHAGIEEIKARADDIKTDVLERLKEIEAM